MKSGKDQSVGTLFAPSSLGHRPDILLSPGGGGRPAGQPVRAHDTARRGDKMLSVISDDVAPPFQPVPPEINHQGPNRHGSHIEGKGYLFAQRLPSVKPLYRYDIRTSTIPTPYPSFHGFFPSPLYPGASPGDELRGPKFPAAWSSPIGPVEGTGRFVPRPSPGPTVGLNSARFFSISRM